MLSSYVNYTLSSNLLDRLFIKFNVHNKLYFQGYCYLQSLYTEYI